MKRGTCKLCLNEADLQRSHFLVRALYKLSSDDGELPILMSPNLVIQDQSRSKITFCARAVSSGSTRWARTMR